MLRLVAVKIDYESLKKCMSMCATSTLVIVISLLTEKSKRKLFDSSDNISLKLELTMSINESDA